MQCEFETRSPVALAEAAFEQARERLPHAGDRSTRQVIAAASKSVPGALCTIRDLWRQKDVGTFSDKYEAQVASHGVVLVRVIPAK